MFNFLLPAWQRLDSLWQEFLSSHCQAQLQEIDLKLTAMARDSIIYPPRANIFRALNDLPPDKIKVVILGQDPYHGDGEANGLAFAVNSGIRLPPTLRNIFKQLSLEYGSPTTNYAGSLLDEWARQGVLLLNSSLTVIKDQPNSLAKLGWQAITDKIIERINLNNKPCVFMLWGNYARSKKSLLNSAWHLVLEAAHPSPLSAHRGFFGCNHFKLANQFLHVHNIAQIKWLHL